MPPGSKSQVAWAALVVCCLWNSGVLAETPPSDHWACFGPQVESLPRYWRLVASQRPPVDRAVRLYERGAEAPDDSGEACRVEYDKRDETRVLWSARYQRDYCRPRVERLLERLVASGFNCVMLDSSDRLQHAEQGSSDESQVQSRVP